MLPSLLVRFIKSLFLKEITYLRDVDTGERIAEYLLQKQLEIHGTKDMALLLNKFKSLMKSLLSSNRTKALLGIGVIAIGIGAISKKVISYPSGGCMKGNKEMTFNWDKSILNKY